MGGVEGVGDGPQERGRLDRVEGAAGQPAGEAPAAGEGHHQEATAVLLARVVDRDDVRMAQRQQRLALTPEAHPEGGVGPDLPVHQLEGGGAPQRRVADAVDRGLAASPDALDQLPGADRPALEGRRHRRAGSSARAVDWAQARAVR